MIKRLDYDAFYRLLADSVSDRATCTIFGRTDSNHSVIIGLDEGRIVCLRCGAKKGMEAVAALRDTQGGTFRVDDSLLELHSTPPPPTVDLIAALHPATMPSQPPAGGTGRPVKPTREAVLLCDLLSRYIGPVAPVLCAEQIGAIGGLHYRKQLEQVLGQLAHEIGDATEASEFVSEAYRQIGPLLPLAPEHPAGVTTSQDPGMAFDAVAAASALCGIVSDYLGPVAPIVCEEKIAEVGGLRGRQELELAIRNLAGEIGESDEAKQFAARARAAFHTILT